MLRVHQLHIDDIAVLRLRGRMDPDGDQRLSTVIDLLLARGARMIVLNIAAMPSADGRAISALLRSLHKVRDHGGDIWLVEPAGVDELMTMTALCVHFTVCENEEEAIATIRRGSREESESPEAA